MGIYNFENIRSFKDKEVHDKLLEILDDERFLYILKKIYPDERITHLKKELNSVNSIFDFQKKYISEYVKSLIKLTVTNLNVSGIKNLKTDSSYLFISNHRDIILDSTLINHILLSNGHKTSEIAIGNNLLIYKWIENLVRLNKSFIVRRDLRGKEMLAGSQKLSAYIRETILNRKTSVWIAQREGRTKNGIDKTDPAILKMLNMSGSNDFTKSFCELNIVPVSISYEYEPTLESKIAATYSLKTRKKYTKTLEEDLKDMGRGLYGLKGEINIVFGKPVNGNLKSIENIKKRNEKYTALARQIDYEIFKNYKLTKSNYIAFDILTGSKKFLKEKKYEKAEETKMRVQCKKSIALIDGDKNILEQIYFGIYANPLISKIKL